MPQKSYFDQFSKGYSGGIENPVKKFFGKNLESYLKVKVDWLLESIGVNSKKNKLLDYGCGAGHFIKLLNKSGYKGIIKGCDISGGMIKEAKKTCNFLKKGDLYHVDQAYKWAKNEFNNVVLCCVLHHVKKENISLILKKTKSLLKTNGSLHIFEHNPFNPLTQYIVRTTKIDKNAELVSMRSLKKMLYKTGFKNIQHSFILVFPPIFRCAITKKIEKKLSKLPIGAQYMISCKT